MDNGSVATLYYILYLFMRLGIVLYALLFLSKSKYSIGYKRVTPFLLMLLFLWLCVYAVSGDYWSYRYWYDFGGSFDDRIEPIWGVVKKIIPWGYSVFRAIVWGAGLVLFAKTIELCGVDKMLSYCLFGVFYFHYYCYARAAIALSFIIFAFVVLCRRKELHTKLVNWLLVLLFAIVGLSMHRSMFMIIPALFLPFFVELNRKTLRTLIILFPVFAVIFNAIFPYIYLYIGGNEFVGEAAKTYMSLDYDKRSRFIAELMPRLPFLIFYLMAMFRIKKYKNISFIIEKISAAAFYIIYISFLFATVSSVNGMTFFYRFINMAFPLMIITIAYTIENIDRMKKASIIFLMIMACFVLIQIRYILFKNPNLIIDEMMSRYLNMY